MTKIGKKGFTLIELLAVITIMGILMLVAIPAISRTIENSRRDTFANAAKEYVNAVRNAVLADNISCDSQTASGTPDGIYYFVLSSGDDGTIKDLMEAGGKSPFGGANMSGYVKWVKTTTDGKTTTKYWISLTDTGMHGLSTSTDATPDPTEVDENGIKRSIVKTKLSKESETSPADSDATECSLN